MRPGPLLLKAIALAVLLFLGLPFSPWFGYAGALILIGALAGALIEARVLLPLRIPIVRDAVTSYAVGEGGALRFAIPSQGLEGIRGIVRQTFPTLFAEAAAEAPILWSGGTAKIEFPVQARKRGRASLDAPHALITRYGFVERHAPGECPPAETVVSPGLHGLRRVGSDLDQFVLRGFGSRAGARGGKGREFDRLRDYVAGDDLRDIAWKVSARRARLTVREFRLDRSQDILICVDRGLRMATREGKVNRLDHALHAANLLAYACHRMEDRSAVLEFAARPGRFIPAGRGAHHLSRVAEFAVEVDETREPSDYLTLAAHVRALLHHRTLVVIFTTLPEDGSQELVQALRLLRPQHLPLLVAFEDRALGEVSNLAPTNETEVFESLAAHDILARRAETLRSARRLGAIVTEAPPGEVGFASINSYLEIKRRQIL